VANLPGPQIPDDWSRLTSDKSPVRESRTPGSVGEALSNQRLYPTAAKARKSRVPTSSVLRKATWTDALLRASAQPGVVKETGMCGSSLHGNRETSGLAGGWTPPVRVGKTRSRSR
jgi:hypothetical protein